MRYDVFFLTRVFLRFKWSARGAKQADEVGPWNLLRKHATLQWTCEV